MSAAMPLFYATATQGVWERTEPVTSSCAIVVRGPRINNLPKTLHSVANRLAPVDRWVANLKQNWNANRDENDKYEDA